MAGGLAQKLQPCAGSSDKDGRPGRRTVRLQVSSRAPKPDTVGTEARMGKVISSSQAGRGGTADTDLPRPIRPYPNLGQAGGVRNHPCPDIARARAESTRSSSSLFGMGSAIR